MEYRRLGRSGLQVSALSFGAWVTFAQQIGNQTAAQLMHACYDAGVNFFDNAEAYAAGRAEVVMGQVLKESGWARSSFVVSSKVFFGAEDDKPNQTGLSRKHVFEACDAALRRLQVDYLDLYFCHRPDPETPIDETVRAMGDLVRQGCIAFSPLAQGMLTGKYLAGDPGNTRISLENYGWLKERFTNAEAEQRLAVVARLADVANDLGVSLPKLGLAWCLKNPHVSTVITGASKVEQVHENMAALEVVPKLTPEVMARIEEVAGTRPG